MSGIFRPETGSKRLDFSGGGSDRKVEFLLGGALALIILGAIALSLWSFIGPDDEGDDGETQFKCVACGHQFEASTKTESGDEMAPPPGMIGPPPRECPECGKDAYPMNQCPECGEWFLPEENDDGARYITSETECPHCHANYIEAMRKKRSKR